jgi:hypothetical protein
MSSHNEGFTGPEMFRLTDADLAGFLAMVAELDEPSADIPWDHPMVVAALERLAVAYTIFTEKETSE